MSQTCLVIAALSLLLACPLTEDLPQPAAEPQKDVLQEIYVHPENFHLGQEVEVTGALIRPTRNSAKFICRELRLPDSGPPVAGSTCVAVSGLREQPGGGLNIHKLSGAQWDEKRAWIPYRVTVRCSVEAFMPGTPPERLVLSCDWSSLKGG
jgi:hypothetical protein